MLFDGDIRENKYSCRVTYVRTCYSKRIVLTSACQADFVHLWYSMFHTCLSSKCHLDLNQFPVFCLQRVTGTCLSPLHGKCYGSSSKGALHKHCSQIKNKLILFVSSIELSLVFSCEAWKLTPGLTFLLKLKASSGEFYKSFTT